MPRFVEGQDRHQVTLLPESLDDFIAEDNAVRVVDAFVDELDLAALGFEGAAPATTGRPSYHPSVLLKIYIYGYLNKVQSSRRLERECQRNVELMWLTGRLAPDFKTIADFRRDNGAGVRNVCRRFVELCRQLKLFSQAVVAIDGSKFKAVNARDRNFTPAKVQKRQEQIEDSIKRYLDALDTADRTAPPTEFQAKAEHLQDKLRTMRDESLAAEADARRTRTSPPSRRHRLVTTNTIARNPESSKCDLSSFSRRRLRRQARDRSTTTWASSPVQSGSETLGDARCLHGATHSFLILCPFPKAVSRESLQLAVRCPQSRQS